MDSPMKAHRYGDATAVWSERRYSIMLPSGAIMNKEYLWKSDLNKVYYSL